MVISSTRVELHLSAAPFSLGELVGHVAVRLPDRELQHSLNQRVERFGLVFLLFLREKGGSSRADLDVTTYMCAGLVQQFPSYPTRCGRYDNAGERLLRISSTAILHI